LGRGTGKVGGVGVTKDALYRSEFGREDDGNDESVNGHDFTENDGDEIFSSYTGGFDCSAKDC
jgi:hypothetical protein